MKILKMAKITDKSAKHFWNYVNHIYECKGWNIKNQPTIYGNTNFIVFSHRLHNFFKTICIIISVEREKGSKKISNWRLNNCEWYVTLEPCPMCAGAIVNSRFKKIYIGTMDEKNGACGSVSNILEEYKQNFKVELETLNHESCKKILKDFFKELREVKNNK